MAFCSKGLSLLLFFSICIQSVYAENVQYIEVFGQASVTQSKTQQKLTVRLLEQGASITKTVHRLNTKRKRVIKALKTQHIKQTDVVISDIAINSQNKQIDVNLNKVYLPAKGQGFVEAEILTKSNTKQTSRHDKHSIKQSAKNEHLYYVSQLVEYEVEEVNYLGQLLDNLIKLGIEDINLNTSEKYESEQYNKALNLAIINAKNKANDLANALNVKLEQVLEVQEIKPNIHSLFNTTDLLQNSIEDQLNQVISAQVRISFAISSQ